LVAPRLGLEPGTCGLTGLVARRSAPFGVSGRNSTPIVEGQQGLSLLAQLAALRSISLLRDKFHAHFDKDYFFDRDKLQAEAPIDWAGLTEVGNVMTTMLNNYSADFDGELFAGEAIGIDDLTRLLHAARKGNRK